MVIRTKNLISMSEANQNFSQVAKRVDQDGAVIILKNNKPKYVVIPFDITAKELTDNERVELIARRILEEHKQAFETLAKS